ncbi:MAG: TadE/TadG family type IV pilus assembly protein [Frankiaceae bacterium]
MRARWQRGDGGAAAVEFALILPVFLTLVFGLISAGLAYFHKIGLTQDVRESGRYAATYVDSSGNSVEANLNSYLNTVLDSLVRNASEAGDLKFVGTAPSATLDTTDASQVVCAAYITAAGTVTRVSRGVASLPAANGGACYADGLGTNAGYPRVQVYAQGDARWNLLIFSSGPKVTFRSATVYRYERPTT